MKKGKTNKLTRRILSIVLTVALVAGLMPGNMLTVSAEGIEAGKSEEIVVETVSSNDASATTECTCGTDDPAFHATNCPAYIAPENPQCTCAEKCTEDTLNIWCDVCGVQGVNACQGEDTAVAYEIVANGTCGAEGNESSVTWSLDSDGTLTISGSGAMADYELVLEYPYHYTTPWHNTDNDDQYQNSNIKKVVVKEGVTHIGNSAFKDFTELTSISIPNTVKSIGNGSVSYCRKLESLVIPNSVTSIGEEAFDDNRMLTSVTIGNSVKSIGAYAFSSVGWNADKNFTITLPKSVTSIDSRAFSYIYRGATIRYSCSYNEGKGYSTEYTNATLEQYHLYEYSSSENKINCSGCTCGEYSSSTATLSLSSDEPIYYTGEEIKPAVTVSYPDDWVGDEIEPSENNCTYSFNINAGTATCTFKYAEGVEASLDFTIQRATPTAEMFTYIENAVYDGNEKSANVVANQDITGMGEITIKYYQNDIEVTPVNVGTYTVKIDVSEGDNCTDIVGLEIGTFETTKATPTAEMFTYIESAVYDGTEKSANVVVKDGITGIGAITNIKYYQNGTEVTPINAGTYTVKIDVAEGDNYDAATDIEVGTFEITKANTVITWNDQTLASTGEEADITAPTITFAGTDKPEVELTYSYKAQGDAEYTVGLPTACGIYDVKVNVSATDNYNAVEDTMTLTITCTDADNNGVCDYCENYIVPERVDEYYQIANAGNLMWFAQQVNEGRTTINAKLTADIDMKDIDWTMMSSFAGTFDGDGHTISGLNGHIDIWAQKQCHGFIRTLDNCGFVKNLTFTGAKVFNHEGGGAISAIIVYTNHGVVENCVVKDSNIHHGDYDTIGVVVGANRGTIRNCASISNTMVRRFSSAKAICGFVWTNSGSIENCFNYDCTYQNGSNRYAFTQSNTGTITNCYYYESSETISDTVATAKTADQFASGEVAYLLNGSSSEDVTWYQTLGTDAYPVLDSKHGTVYYGYISCSENAQPEYSNQSDAQETKPDHVEGKDVFFTLDGEIVPTCTERGVGHTECEKCHKVMQTNLTVKASGHTGGTATCKNKAECSVCHEGYGELDKNNHAGETEVKDAKKATCAVDGYTGDTYCKDCGAKIATGTKIAKTTNHAWDGGVVTKQPTATEKGEKTYTCSVCKTTKKEEIPALGAPKKGAVAKSGKATYKVTKSDLKNGTAAYVGPLDKKATKVTIPATVKIDGVTFKVTSIEKNAFKNNKKVKTVTIGKNVTTIGDNAFYKCTALTKISIPSKVKTIGKNAFYGCKKMTSATIGKSVSKIGAKAFYGCSKLKTLKIKTTKLTTKKIGSKAFSKTPKSMKVTIPKKKFKTYKSMLIKRGVNKKAKFKKS